MDVSEAHDNLRAVEAGLILGELVHLLQMEAQIAALHEIQDEVEELAVVEGVLQVGDESAVHLGQNVALVDCRHFLVLELQPLLVQHLHGEHCARVQLAAAKDLAKAAAPENAVHVKVVLGDRHVQFQVLPLAIAHPLRALQEHLPRLVCQVLARIGNEGHEELLDVRAVDGAGRVLVLPSCLGLELAQFGLHGLSQRQIPDPQRDEHRLLYVFCLHGQGLCVGLLGLLGRQLLDLDDKVQQQARSRLPPRKLFLEDKLLKHAPADRAVEDAVKCCLAGLPEEVLDGELDARVWQHQLAVDPFGRLIFVLQGFKVAKILEQRVQVTHGCLTSIVALW
eukprot:m.162951 g.162951  ORF g.162951 m.162951 type:complete len:337 (+) comp17102_c0_seq1:3390-4400(+)